MYFSNFQSLFSALHLPFAPPFFHRPLPSKTRMAATAVGSKRARAKFHRRGNVSSDRTRLGRATCGADKPRVIARLCSSSEGVERSMEHLRGPRVGCFPVLKSS